MGGVRPSERGASRASRKLSRTPLAIQSLPLAPVLAVAGLGSAGVAFVGAPMYAPNAAAAILCYALA